ncbi:MAG TPA: guanylate kinase [Candidatus Sumerlaeota bacterium]|nr:guanylate kinase [Candidatus Sumerlaeota bacterium]HPK03617.1 guanylate kinase [Candidatus Sumerlaeota bacterium]
MSLYRFQRRGLLFVISAPSGGGKSAVLTRLLASEADLHYSVSVTSRAPRPDEVEGRDYHFVSRAEFESLVQQDVFYEWAEVHGNLYGTRSDTVEGALAEGRDVALDLDVQGGLSAKYRSPDAVLVFLMPPSFQVLEQRLRQRATDSEEAIRMRLENARREMIYWRQYNYLVVNEDIDESVEKVRRILYAERHRVSRLKLLQ